MSAPMRMATTKLAVFDCDGTLVDGQADICDVMEEAFASLSLTPPERNDVRRIVGLSLQVAIRQLSPDLDESQVHAVTAAYKEAFFTRRSQGNLREQLYPGAEKMLRALHGLGWQLAVATGKSDRGLNAVLTNYGLIDLFVSLQTADRHPSKPHPAMLEAALFDAGASAQEAVMVGDTTFDIIMARDAGVHSIGVEWGYHEPQELRDAGAQDIASDMGHLAMCLENWS